MAVRPILRRASRLAAVAAALAWLAPSGFT